MFCTNCGYKLKDGDRFCENCGTPVENLVKTIKEEPAETQTENSAAEPTAEEEPGTDFEKPEQPENTEMPLENTAGQAAQPEEAAEPLTEATEPIPEPVSVAPEDAAEPTPESVPVGPEQPSEVSGDTIPELEKKIMKNMEDELILEMPEAAMGDGARAYSESGHAENVGRSHREPGRGEAGAENRREQGPGENGMRNQREPVRGEAGAEPQRTGAYQEQPGNHPPYEYIPGNRKPEKTKKKNGKKKAWIIALSSLIAVLLIVLAVFAFLLSNPTNKLQSAIKNRDWKQVEAIYEKSFSGNEKKQAQADELLKNEVEAITSAYTSDSMDYQTAKGHLTAIAAFWNDDSVSDALVQIRELYDSRSAFDDGEKAMKAEDYETAIAEYKKVIKADSNYETAQKQLESARKSYRKAVLEEAEALEKKNDYDGAARTIAQALKILPGDSDLTKKQEEIEQSQEDYGIQSVLEQCKKAADQGNYYTAMEGAKEALAEHNGNADLQAALEEYKTKYQEDILKKAEDALGTDQNYEAALIVLDGALNTLGGDYPEIEQALREKKESYVQEQLKQSQQETDTAEFVGTWRGSQVTSDGVTMNADTFLYYAGLDSDQLLMIMRADGALHVQLLGETAEGTWKKTGDHTYTLTVEGADQIVTLENGRLTMDLDGVVLIFVREAAA